MKGKLRAVGLNEWLDGVLIIKRLLHQYILLMPYVTPATRQAQSLLKLYNAEAYSEDV